MITASTERLLHASADDVYALLADYREARPKILTSNYLGYVVQEGGTGAGTVITYRFHSANRERDYRLQVSEPEAGRTLLEEDVGSSFRTEWHVEPVDEQHSRLRLTSSWESRARGIGGFFERRFAPAGLRRIYVEVLDRLEAELQQRHPHPHD